MESLLFSAPKLPVTNLEILAMLLLLALISIVAELWMEKSDGARPLDNGLVVATMAQGMTIGLAIVERLLVKLGTSSTDILISGPGSPAESRRLSLIDEVPVPILGTSNDA
jgi:hypothetical protein